MVREASAAGVSRASVEPLLLALEELARSPGLSPEEHGELEELFEVITADLLHSPDDREKIEQNFLLRYKEAIEAARPAADA
jgi:hypothetical protein